MGDTLLSRYQLQVFAGVQRAARARGAQLVSFQLGTSVRDDDGAFDSSFMLDLPSEAAFDGLIVATNILSGVLPRALLEQKFSTWGRPLVSLGELCARPSVLLECEQGLSAVVEHLVTAHGCRRFAFIEGTPGNPDAVDRARIVEATLGRLGIALSPELVLPGNFLEPSGARAVRTLLDERGVPPSAVDAIVACNDEMAIGAMRELAARGLRVPEDVAVIGFDDDQRGRNSPIPLTTVHQPVERLAALACDTLLRMLSGASVEPSYVVSATPVYRRSCGCERSRARATESRPGLSLDETLDCEEARCFSRAAREEPSAAAAGWIKPVFAALRVSARSGDPSPRLAELERLAADACYKGIDASRWATEIHLLTDALEALEPGDVRVARCREVLVEARLSVAVASARSLSMRNLDALQQANAVRVIGEALVCARSLTAWTRTIEATVPALGVPYYCACLFSDESRGELKVVAQGGCEERPTLELPHDVADIWRKLPASLPPSQAPRAPTFPTADFLPAEGVRPTSELLVYPLLFAERALGYVVFGLPSDHSLVWMLEHIAAHMSCGLFTLARADELVLARGQAEIASRAKSEFLAVMSHEIRTPLTAVCGNVDLCLASELSTSQRNQLTRARNAARGLRELVDDLLDFSKIEAARLELESVDFALEEVIGQVVANHGLDATKKGLELVVDCDAELTSTLVGDPFRLSQVLSNLLSNAIKFTAQGEVVLRARQLARTEQEVDVELSVRDTGIGMTDDQLARIFRPFTQADSSTTRRYGGSGLGLSISRSLVALMQGTIEVTSRPGAGSCFSVAIRFGAGPTCPVERTWGRALVVEDNASQQAALSRFLTARGLSVTLAPTGAAALALLANGSAPFSVAVVDKTLPDIDGAALVGELARRLEPSGVLAFLAVADPGLGAPERGRGGALIRQLPKPWTGPELARVLDRGGSAAPPNELRDVLSRRSLRDKSVLVVQDDVVTLDWLREVLKMAGARVETAETGLQAVRAVAERSFDAILMDLRLPAMSGVEATRAIRRHPSHRSMAILGLTASATTKDVTEARAAGMNDCIVTPIEADALVRLLERLLDPQGSPTLVSVGVGVGVGVARGRITSASTLLRAVRFPLDTQKALARLDGNRATYRRLLARFLDAHHAAADLVQAALAKGNVPAALRLCHPLGSAAANIGALHLHRLSVGLEAALSEKGEVGADELEEFTSSHAAVLAAAKSTLASLAAESMEHASAIGRHSLGPVLSRLALLLDEHDAAAIDCLRELEQLGAGAPDLSEPLRRLRDHVQTYDFDAARRALDDVNTARPPSAPPSAPLSNAAR